MVSMMQRDIHWKWFSQWEKTESDRRDYVVKAVDY